MTNIIVSLLMLLVRTAYCFDFNDLANGCVLISNDDRFKFKQLKEAIRMRLVVFSSIEVYYLIEEVYTAL